MPKQTLMKTKPQTNIQQRKVSVLKFHKENIRIFNNLKQVVSATNTNIKL